MRDYILALGSRHEIPPGLTFYPCAGFCLNDERLNEGAIAAVDPDGIVPPNTVAVFEDGNGLLVMKVYLGISADGAFARLMKQEDKGPLAVFWMANPESLISVPLTALRFLAPVVGTLSDRGYEPLGEWQFTEDQAEFVALAMRCIVRQPLLAFKFADCPAG
jgi:hypothetical protein